MGILNTTPDSFSDGGKYTNIKTALQRVGEMADAGATIVDIGGESTRPGSEPVSIETELDRTIPVISKIADVFPELLISIDTTKYEVAARAIEAGAHILNDVSGLEKEPRFAELCSGTETAYICMHSQGNPKTMQQKPSYSDVVEEIYQFLQKKLQFLKEKGVESVIIDPGIGFGKTLRHNLELVDRLPRFLDLNTPVMIGASRKSSIGEILDGRGTDGRLAGTIALHYHCLINGASIIRVHDVQEAADSVKIFNAVQSVSI
ncbi:dihydropteroate synthase [Rhodohalobacter sp. SW132]|nr:dihydropteroate synthase [Rhodohalobacter sp. SW132]